MVRIGLSAFANSKQLAAGLRRDHDEPVDNRHLPIRQFEVSPAITFRFARSDCLPSDS